VSEGRGGRGAVGFSRVMFLLWNFLVDLDVFSGLFFPEEVLHTGLSWKIRQ